jgi:hypothetical protein
MSDLPKGHPGCLILDEIVETAVTDPTLFVHAERPAKGKAAKQPPNGEDAKTTPAGQVSTEGSPEKGDPQTPEQGERL